MFCKKKTAVSKTITVLDIIRRTRVNERLGYKMLQMYMFGFVHSMNLRSDTELQSCEKLIAL